MTANSASAPKPETDSWPEDGLEHLGRCPLCASKAREVLYAGLTDAVFGCAPGKWTLWKCGDCSCAYLDPRPTQSSIGLAYAQYYTHGSKGKGGARSLLRLLDDWALRPAMRDYVNHRYGHKLRPSLLAGRLACALNPRLARMAETRIRHLPPPGSDGEALLDVGCGDGSFLMEAKRLGYAAVGLDTDEVAANVARGKGFGVTVGQLPSPQLQRNSYSHVTMHHVIEHLHDPIGVLREVHDLLRPRGRVWLATPNINSPLLDTFRQFWRGLEPPRHLILFTPDLAQAVLQRAGFVSVQLLPPSLEARGMARRSYAVMQGCLQIRQPQLPVRWRIIPDQANRIAAKDNGRGETIYAVGYKEG